MKNKFSWKAFFSFGLTYSFSIIIVSGILLYVSAPGSYAHWVNWTILGFTKEGWQSLHTVFSFAYVILSLFHLFTVNWKTFLSYFKAKTKTGMNKKRDFFISTTLTLVFFFGIIYLIPPFKSVMDFGEYLTASWEQEEEEPPIPHAELLTLFELAEQLKLPLSEEITRKLTVNEIKFNNTEQTLQEIAKINETTSMEIYNQLTKKIGYTATGKWNWKEKH